ncbi:uncharacterized protein [Rutidosis leptorrhynchoides]|uniref:uncharacterized protein n=1 Tax=Rutidosis leptorrhynchoides TaxID=125765 RepID=UPI003A9A1F93
MYEHCFDQLSPTIKGRLNPPRVPLIGFSGERCWPIGEVDLDFTIGEPPLTRTKTLDFVVVRAVSQHNILLGRVAMMKMGIITSTVHQLVKFYTSEGIGTLVSTYDREKVIMAFRKTEERPEKASQATPGEHRHLRLGIRRYDRHSSNAQYRRNYLLYGTQAQRIQALRANQKKRNFANERDEAACKEVEELLQAGIIREAKYPTWVANPVMVKKTDGGWRMCVDFTNINKACPKDCYPLPEIDWKVESLTGYKYKCFLDAYKGYHQIQMAEEDEEKTSFFTRKGIYCYKKMPFGLKNAGATYQRLVDKVFHKQIGRNLEAYVDDMVIKSPEESTLLKDIQETFDTLRTVNMKLNPKKCSFGVEEGKFLGYYITKKGILPNPEKVDKLQQLKTPTTVKEMQSLNGKLASLSRFLSKGAERQLPFLKVLKGCLGAKKISWTEEAEKAFIEMKAHIANLPTLTSPKMGETLYLYLATSKECISAVIVAERERIQVPIYFVSRVLQGAEVNYPELEKLTLALVHTARKLRRYFQAYPIIVLTNKQIRQVLMKPEKSGRMAKWATELGEHDINFQARHSIKAQVLADFMSETKKTDEENNSIFAQIITPTIETKEWKLFIDGASSSDGSGVGLMLINPEGQEFTYTLRFEFSTTNNEAEYEALLAGLRIAKEIKIEHLQAFVDSQLVANQVLGIFEARQPIIQLYLSKVRELVESFRSFTIEHVRRSQNKKADALSKLASITFAHLAKEVLVEVLEKRSIEAQEVHDLIIKEENTWMKPLREYLELGILPEDKKEARKIRIKAPPYKIMNGALYRKSFLTPWLRYVGPNQASMIIREMHEGICGLHSGPRLIVIHAKVQNQPKQDMISVLSAWPFSKWGIDLIGPLTEAPGGYKWLVVVIDYFTKWTEEKPLSTTPGKQIEKFVWEHIVCRFGIPQEIVSDNGNINLKCWNTYKTLAISKR